ncbi:hypothetical protein [Bergeriella denitrificans]|nr:hypothetical protein [Bergeriella denitrificans]
MCGILGEARQKIYWFKQWLLRGSRLIQLGSALGFLGYAVVFGIDGDLLYEMPIYEKFKTLNAFYLALFFTGFSGAQISALFGRGVRGEAAAGYLLLVAALIWLLVSVAFQAAYPPLNTGFVLPTVLWLMCTLTGISMMEEVRRKQLER